MICIFTFYFAFAFSSNELLIEYRNGSHFFPPQIFHYDSTLIFTCSSFSLEEERRSRKRQFSLTNGMEKAQGKWSFIKCFSFSSFCFLFISYSCPPSTDIALTLLQTAIHIHSPIENDSPMDGGKKQRIVYEQGRFEEVSWKLRLHSHTHTRQVLFSRDTKGYFEALRVTFSFG